MMREIERRAPRMQFDLTLTPLYRLNGQEQPSLPGLMATVPPRKAARGRDQDRVIVYLLATGNAALSTGESVQLASRAAVTFYETPGTVTAALRAAAESINKPLYDRNISGPGRGQYAAGHLMLAALRESQLTVLLSGPMHAYLLGAQGPQHIFDTLSGHGLGLGQTTPHYFSQITLHANDRLLVCAKTPPPWETAAQDVSPASLEATRRRFMNMTGEDVSAVLIQATEGTGGIKIMRPVADEKAAAVPIASAPAPLAYPPMPANEAEARDSQPSAYGIPAQPAQAPPLPVEASASELVSALPRADRRKAPTGSQRGAARAAREAAGPREPSRRTRQAARTITTGMQAWRAGVDRLQQALQRFMPRLLPGADPSALALSTPALAFIAVLVPLVVVTVASVVYFRYGRSVQYEDYLVQARDAKSQAVSLQDAAAQREAWQRVLFYLDKAEEYNQGSDTRTLRGEAQQSLDKLQGIARLRFQPVLNAGFGTQISRLAASENDVYALDGQRGSILHVALTASGFQRDNAFNCVPGAFGGYTVGPMVDLLSLPTLNTINASVIGIDAAGNLLYCAPGQVAQAIPLPPPDTNWGRVKAMALDAGNLYVLDAQSHAVWVYVGKDGTFVDRPYFFFGGQIPELADAIDLAVNGDDLYILHSDGHLSTCSYSRIETVPTRCVDPASLVNPLPAYRDVDLFTEAHFTQMMFTPAPDSALLMLDSDSQGVFRFAPRSLELQSQLRPLAGRDNPLPQGAVGAMAVSPNHVLYFALQDRIYFATDAP
jgi:hypothetical protein